MTHEIPKITGLNAKIYITHTKTNTHTSTNTNIYAPSLKVIESDGSTKAILSRLFCHGLITNTGNIDDATMTKKKQFVLVENTTHCELSKIFFFDNSVWGFFIFIYVSRYHMLYDCHANISDCFQLEMSSKYLLQAVLQKYNEEKVDILAVMKW